MDHPDHDLSLRLTALADRAPYVAADPALDLGRGRRRVRRRRAVLGAGAVAAVAAVALVTALLPGAGDPRGTGGPGVASQAPAPSTALDTAPSARVTERRLAFGEGLDVVTPGDRLDEAGEGLAQVVADHLDPDGEHAVLPAENHQASSDAGGLTALGVKVGWQVPGEDGEGVVELMVRRAADPARASCASAGPACTELDPPSGAVAARVVQRGDSTGVAVARADGSLVTVSTSTLFGNNSLAAVSRVDVTTEQLLAAAADPRVLVPDVNTSDQLSSFPLEGAPDVVLQLGQDELPGPSSTFTLDGGGPDGDGGYSAVYSGLWSGPGGRGRLTWSPDDAPAVAGSATCVEEQFSRCEVQTRDGRDVFVGHLRDGDGFRVYAIGPRRAMSLTFEGTGYPVDRAVAFVLDLRLQED